MTYRNPRFSIMHAAREAVAEGGSTTVGLGTADPTTPVHRLYDGRHRLPCLITASAGDDIRVETQRAIPVNDRLEINRFIMPGPNNFMGSHGRFRLLGNRDGAWEDWRDETGTVSAFAPITNGLIAIDLTGLATSGDVGKQCAGLRWEMIDGEPDYVYEVPELYWTHTLQPKTGVVQTFGPGDWQPNLARARSRGGTTYVFERGPSLRRFRFQHRGLSGEDWELYEYIVSTTMQGNGQLWYEHPGTGDAFKVLDDMSDPSRWTVGQGTLEVASQSRSGNALTWTSLFAGTHVLEQNTLPEMDLTNKMIRLVVRPYGDISWITQPNSFDFRIGSASVEHESRYDLANTWINDVSQARYWIMYIDLDEPAENQGLYGPADLRHADRYRLRWAPTAVDQTIDIDEFAVIDKSMNPVLCEIASYSAVQDHPVPNGPAGPTYTVNMELAEVLV